ncbi:MAG: adenylate/guanylate cyclase domain-containing protein [Salinibacter sp.]
MSDGRRLAAIMFTDFVGYSALSQQNEELALDLLNEHRQLLRPAFADHGGTEIKSTGDGFLVEFGSSLEAVECAIDVQTKVRSRNATVMSQRQFEIRIGIHLGDVEHREGDVFGDGVNIASRIEPLAPEGGICISEDVARQVRNKLSVSLEGLGEHSLKNIEGPLAVYRVAMPWEEIDSTESAAQRNRSRIAVLPLVNISPDPEDEYFTDGMTEELIYRLSKINGLRVIAQTSVMPYKRTEKSVATIGQELQVGIVLEGSVRKANNQVRITAQLIDTETEEHLWAERYDRALEDVFAIQTDIAEQVAQELEITLNPQEKQQITQQPTENLEAYNLYLKGRYLWNQRSAEGLNKAVRYFTEAIQRDPNFAQGYSGLADCYALMPQVGALSKEEAGQKAVEAAEKAIQLDNSLAEAHTSMGFARANFHDDLEGAEAALQKALELNPDYAPAQQWYGQLLLRNGRARDALAAMQRAQELDPLSLISNLNAAFIHIWLGQPDAAYAQLERAFDIYAGALTHLYFAYYYHTQRQYEAAIQQADRALTLDEMKALSHVIKADAYRELGQHHEALKILEEAKANTSEWPQDTAIGSSDIWIDAFMGSVYADAGDRAKAEEIVARLKQRPQEHGRSSAIGSIYFALGENDKGFEWLEQAYQDRDAWLMQLRVMPVFDGVRNDPRYYSLLERLQLA